MRMWRQPWWRRQELLRQQLTQPPLLFGLTLGTCDSLIPSTWIRHLSRFSFKKYTSKIKEFKKEKCIEVL